MAFPCPCPSPTQQGFIPCGQLSVPCPGVVPYNQGYYKAPGGCPTQGLPLQPIINKYSPNPISHHPHHLTPHHTNRIPQYLNTPMTTRSGPQELVNPVSSEIKEPKAQQENKSANDQVIKYADGQGTIFSPSNVKNGNTANVNLGQLPSTVHNDQESVQKQQDSSSSKQPSPLPYSPIQQQGYENKKVPSNPSEMTTNDPMKMHDLTSIPAGSEPVVYSSDEYQDIVGKIMPLVQSLAKSVRNLEEQMAPLCTLLSNTLKTLQGVPPAPSFQPRGCYEVSRQFSPATFSNEIQAQFPGNFNGRMQNPTAQSWSLPFQHGFIAPPPWTNAVECYRFPSFGGQTPNYTGQNYSPLILPPRNVIKPPFYPYDYFRCGQQPGLHQHFHSYIYQQQPGPEIEYPIMDSKESTSISSTSPQQKSIDLRWGNSYPPQQNGLVQHYNTYG